MQVAAFVGIWGIHDWFLELIFKEEEPAFLERAQRLAADEGVYLASRGPLSRSERAPRPRSPPAPRA
jgi:hypothetical protein